MVLVDIVEVPVPVVVPIMQTTGLVVAGSSRQM
jgi:hypothetical protein